MKTRTPAIAALLALAIWAPAEAAQTSPSDSASSPPGETGQTSGASKTTQRVQPLGVIEVFGTRGYAVRPDYGAAHINLGPLGNRSIQDTPMSVNVLPESLLVNQQVQTVNEALGNLPSVIIRDQQGMEVSRPQSRGFVGSIAQDIRMDGLNVVGTTAIATENLGSIQVLNGLTGALYGPQPPAGVFNYVLKRPTARPLARLIEGYDSNSIFTEQVDVGGPIGANDRAGYRINALHGQGTGYVSYSNTNRTLLSGAFDFRIGQHTTVETNLMHYKTAITGLPGSVVYGGNSGSQFLPRAIDPTTPGLGQPGAGTDLKSDTVVAKLKHEFDNGWTFQIGGLYENAIRGLFGITNRFTDDLGDYAVTKNFNAIPLYIISSNLAQLNGHFRWLGTENDFSVGTNGFRNRRHNGRDSIAVPLGSGNLADPAVLPWQPTPSNGGLYRSGTVTEQSLVLGDTMHFNPEWAVQAVVSSSYINTTSYNKQHVETSSQTATGVFSPTASVIYTPTHKLTGYLTWARSIEPGPAAPAGTVNENQFLSNFHDKEYEAGVKYAVTPRLRVTADVFRMTQPLAETNPADNVFAVVGTQRNRGVELFAQGDINDELSILGGITWIDARLEGSRAPGTENKMVVGVPRAKTDVALDFHPTSITGLAFLGSVHFESRRAATDTNNSFAPAYWTLDAGVRYSMALRGHVLTMRAQVVNATDRHYYSAIANGNIVGSAGANTAYYAPPRSFMASLELDL